MKKCFIIFCIFLSTWNSLHSQISANEPKEHVVQGQDVFVDYQNYNHGYCPSCQCYPCKCATCPPAAIPVPPPAPPAAAPCAAPGTCAPPTPPCAIPEPSCAAPPPAPCPTPCAPACGTECGISICALGIGIAALATAAVLIVSSGNGHTNH